MPTALLQTQPQAHSSNQLPPLPRVLGSPDRIQEPGGSGEFLSWLSDLCPQASLSWDSGLSMFPHSKKFPRPSLHSLLGPQERAPTAGQGWSRNATELSSVCEDPGYALLTKVALKGV